MTESESNFQRIWRINPAARPVWHRWGEECVVYNDSTGNTHLLTPVVLYLLDELSQQPAPVSLLATSLFEQDDGEDGTDVKQRLHEMLCDLGALEFVEPLTE